MSRAVSYLEVAQTQLQVAIPPSETANPLDAVSRQLNRLLFKFNDKLQGVPLSYSDLKLAPGKEYGRFMADQPWVHIDVFSSVVVFKPQVGMRVTGKITKVSDNHVAILILQLFNASISADEMNKKFAFDYNTNSWVSSSETWKEGDDVEFTISSYQHANGVLNIVGGI